MKTEPGYRGRFAPSPTGPLHMGSLIAAVASFLDARANRGTWLVRMEDLDPPREQPGAAEAILDSLGAHGLVSDEPIVWQSERSAAYDAALERLVNAGTAFPCQCSRQSLAPTGIHRIACSVHDDGGPIALRLRVPTPMPIVFTDDIQGEQHSRLDEEAGDFVIRRKDQLYAYQLAVVVDDAAQGISHIVRGADLLDSTSRQLYLQQVLRLPAPAYLHLPVITHPDGQKLSKQSHAPALQDAAAVDNLRSALRFLGQPPPPAELDAPRSVLAWSAAHWSRTHIPQARQIIGIP